MAFHSHTCPHASHVAHLSLSQNPLCPHVIVANHLMRWLTPFSISHMNSLTALFPPQPIAMSHILLSRLIAPTTFTNYSSGLICFSCFCDDYHIPKSLCMPGSEALLTQFITCLLGVSALHYSTGSTEGLEGFGHWLQLMRCA